MKLDVILQVLEWAAKTEYARDFLDHIIAKARAWAEDDQKVGWDDYLVDALEMAAEYLYEKYRNQENAA